MRGKKSLTAVLAALAIVAARAGECRAEGVLSLTLDRAYEMAIKNSSELKIARFRHMAESERLRLQAWSYVPTLNFSLSDSRTTRYAALDASSVNATSTLTVPITRGGRKRLKNRITSLSLELEGVSLAKSEDELRDACFSLFNKTRILELKLCALRDLEAITARQYEIAKKEFELGKIREIDLVETGVSASSLAQDMFSAETERLSAVYSLGKLIGVDREVSLSLETAIDDGYRGLPIDGAAAKLRSFALARNQDVIESRFRVEEARINNRVADSYWKPNVSLQGTFQLSGERYPLQKANYGLRATVEFPLRLFPVTFSVGFTTSPDIEYGRSTTSSFGTPDSLDPVIDRKLARLALAEAIDKKDSAEKDLIFALDQGILEYNRIRGEQSLIRDKLSIEERKVEIMRLQLDLGQVTRVDYLEGENDLLNTRLDLLNGVLSLIEIERQIEKLAGLEPGELVKFEDPS
jgi:outer membrane protein TolC